MREFVITCAGRDGSHLLLCSIGEHSAIEVVDEPLGYNGQTSGWHNNGATGREVLTRRVFVDRAGVEAVGFPLQEWHAKDSPLDDTRRELIDRGVCVIHLERRNWLRWRLSLLVARQSGVWIDRVQHRPAGQSTERVTFDDPNELPAKFEILRNAYAVNRAAFAGLESTSVYFEDLCDDYAREMARVFRFLGVEPEPVEPQTRRQESRTLPDIITNYADVADALAGTPFAWMLRVPTG